MFLKFLPARDQCEIKKAGSATSDQLKIGSELFNGDQIITGNDTYLGLLHRTGKTIEIGFMDFIRLEDGKNREEWVELDGAKLMNELGMGSGS